MIGFEKYFNREELKPHLELCKSYCEVLINNEMFKAAALLGSFAKGSPDRLSDLDIIVWVDKENTKVASRILFDLSFYPKIHSWEKDWQDDHIFGKFIFENFISAEIHVLALENNFRLRNPYIILKNSNDLVESKFEPGQPPKHEDFAALAGGVDGMVWELFDMIKWWDRGNTQLVKNHLRKIVNTLDVQENNANR